MSKHTSEKHLKRILIGNLFRKKQRELANRIGILFGKLSNGAQKMVFFFSFTVAGIYCLFLLFGGGSGGIPHSGNIQQPVLPSSRKIDSSSHLARDKVIGIRKYLDSLSNTSYGRLRRDSILSKNPGLIDSLLIWEKQLELNLNK